MRIKKRYLIWTSIILVAAIVVLFSDLKCLMPLLDKMCVNSNADKINETKIKQETKWSVDSNGYLSFPHREEVLFVRQNYSETDELLISKVIFKSLDEDVYGLLVLPKKIGRKMPAMVLIPGAGVSKESELALAKNISSYDIAVFVYDQRGVGETKGGVYDLESEYRLFSQGIESNYHKLIYDALLAFDLLQSAEFVDSEMILFSGESLGGRVAIIAGAIEPRTKGVLVISSSGLGIKPQGTDADRFLLSIDPDHYINRTSRLVMMHNEQDRNVPIGAAARTYQMALDKKRFVLVNDSACNHGYCESMHEGLLAGLQYLYG